MLLGCRQSSLQIDVILSLQKKKKERKSCLVDGEQNAVRCGSARLTTERAERDKDTMSETQETQACN